MRIHEYDCDCECRAPWWQTCAFIAGGVYNDTNGNDVLDLESDPLFVGLPFKITLYSIDKDGDESKFVDQKTSTDGRYSFAHLAGGVYNVSLSLPDGYRVEEGENGWRIVTVTCVRPDEHRHEHDDDDDDEETTTSDSSDWQTSDSDSDDKRKRSIMAVGVKGVHSQVLTILNAKLAAAHIADNVNFLVAPSDEIDGSLHPSHDHDDSDDDLDDHGSEEGSSGIVIAVIIIIVVLMIAACCIWLFFYMRRIPNRKSVV